MGDLKHRAPRRDAGKWQVNGALCRMWGIGDEVMQFIATVAAGLGEKE